MQERGEGVSSVQETPGSIDITSTESEPVESSESEVVESSESEEPANESARETVARVLRESQEKDAGEGSSEEVKEEIPSGTKKVRKEQTAAKPEEFQIPPPARLNAKEKELFHQMPTELKKAAHNMFRNQEAVFTRANQKLQADIQDVGHIREAVRPYLLSHPELSEQGYTEGRFVSALVAAHQRLTDPKTAKQAWLELAPQVGIDQETVAALRNQAGTAAQPDITRHPQFQALQQKLNAIESTLGESQNQKYEAAVSGIVSEMEAVREEKDQFGRYLYPEMHDDAFIQQAKPLVSALVQAIPNLGYGEALKSAYQTLKGQPGNSGQANQAKFPTQNEQLAKAQAAAVSVRGRSSPSTPGNATDIPPEALGSARDSVKWALNQLRRGV